MFSSWSTRASLFMIESGVDYRERIIELDWPVRFERAADGRTFAVPLPLTMGEPASGCGCDLSQLLRSESSGLLATSFLTEIPRVPLLVDSEAELVMGDSVAIAEYVAEAVAPTRWLLGDKPRRRALIRNFVAHLHADYLPLMSGMSYSQSFRVVDGQRASHASIEQAETLVRVMGKILLESRGPFLFGGFSLADIMVAPIAMSWVGWRFLPSVTPLVREYIATLVARPSVAKMFAEARERYDRIDRFEAGSPGWVASHYRFNAELGLIHDWRKNVFHELTNESAVELFTAAANGDDVEQIVNAFAGRHNLSEAQARADVGSFFDAISPGHGRALDATFQITPREVGAA